MRKVNTLILTGLAAITASCGMPSTASSYLISKPNDVLAKLLPKHIDEVTQTEVYSVSKSKVGAFARETPGVKRYKNDKKNMPALPSNFYNTRIVSTATTPDGTQNTFFPRLTYIDLELINDTVYTVWEGKGLNLDTGRWNTQYLTNKPSGNNGVIDLKMTNGVQVSAHTFVKVYQLTHKD